MIEYENRLFMYKDVELMLRDGQSGPGEIYEYLAKRGIMQPTKPLMIGKHPVRGWKKTEIGKQVARRLGWFSTPWNDGNGD